MAHTVVPTRSDQVTNGRYNQGGDTTVNGNSIGWWEQRIFQKSDTDIPVVITKQYDRAPDILAFELYGKATLQWFILQYANIIDVNTEFVPGVTILLPTRARLFGEILTRRPNIR